jgi:amino acid transporter/nucleotide-binding universal stress UspA family protein
MDSKEQNQNPEIEASLSRELRLFDITLMGVGMMIGAGVFLGIGYSVELSGPGGAILTFSLNGLVALFTAMAYAEMSSAIPRAGGTYNFARIAFGGAPSFIGGWIGWLASAIGGSLYAVTFAIYTIDFLSQMGLLDWVPLPLFVQERTLAVVTALVFVYINYRGVSETGKAGVFTTLGQTLILAVIALVGIGVAIFDPSRLSNFRPFLPKGWTAVLMTMGFTYVAFEGYEVISQAGDEAIEPRRNLPKAILYALGIVAVTYVVVTFAAIVGVKDVGMEPWRWIGQYGEKGFGQAVSRLLPLGKFLVVLAIIFSATSALNATIYAATRASYAMGRDRMLPEFFARISLTRRTPYVALIFTAVIILLISGFLPTMDVASSASIMFLFMFFLSNLCVIKIRRNMADELTYGYVMPLFPLFPILALVVQAVLAIWLFNVSPTAWIIATGWLGVGVVIYVAYSRTHATLTREDIHTFEEAPAPVKEQFSILVPVANPQNVEGMINPIIRLAESKNAAVQLLNMVAIPDQVPLSDAPRYLTTGREAITKAMLHLATRFSIGAAIKYCRNTARGILAAAKEKDADIIVLGWRGTSRRHEFIFGSTVDPVLERSPCNVVVLKNCWDSSYKRVLVPVAGGPNSLFALEVAAIMCDREYGKVIPYNIARPGSITFDLEDFIDKACTPAEGEEKPKLNYPRSLFEPKHVVSKNLIEPILKEAEETDLVVIGASGEKPWRQFAMGSLPERIATLCPKPLIMVKTKSKLQSFFARWI